MYLNRNLRFRKKMPPIRPESVSRLWIRFPKTQQQNPARYTLIGRALQKAANNRCGQRPIDASARPERGIIMKYIAKETFCIEIENDQVFDDAAMIGALVKSGMIKKLEQPILVDGGESWLKLEGRYISQYFSKDELRYCLTQLGIPWDEHETVAMLKKKRDNYIARMKKKKGARA